MPSWARSKYVALAKGFRGQNSRSLKRMVNKVQKGQLYAYRDRRRKRRLFRSDWIGTINAAVREHEVPYSRFIYGLNRSNISLDRKVLAKLAQEEPYSFKAVVDEVKLQARLGLLDVGPESMSYYQALANQNLVFGELKEPQPEKQVLPYMRLRKDLDPKIKEQLLIDDSPHARDRTDDWIFKQKS